MTNYYAGEGLYKGLSTDTKPTAAPVGYSYFETNTGDLSVSDGTYWWLCGMPGPFSSKKVGYLPSGNSIATGVGLISTTVAATGVGTQQFDIISDLTNGKYINCITGITLGNKGGYRVNSSYMMNRSENPRMRIRFKCGTTTLQRLYLGFMTNAEPTGDDPLGAGAHGFMIGCRSADTIFQIISNNTSSATVFTSTGVTIDNTTVHTISLVADNSVPRFSWSLDGSAYSHITNTADIPTETNNLTFVFQNETNDSGIAKSFQMFDTFIQCDR